MNELEKFLPTPPNIGPPLPGILQARWPWAKQPPPAPMAKSPNSPSISYVDVNDGLLKASTEHFRAEQAAKGLVPFVYE